MGGNYYEPAPAIPVTLGKDWQLLGYEHRKIGVTRPSVDRPDPQSIQNKVPEPQPPK
jgi:hypothetical protein